MIVRNTHFRVPAGPTNVRGTTMARRACGCRVYVGVRADNGEAATVSRGCSEAHRQLMERFNMALQDSLVNPSKRPLVDVCEEILQGLEP
jgi:hypothetical protein